MNELTAEPAETIWDTGPKHRGGPLRWFLALSFSFFCLPLLLAWNAEKDAGILAVALIFALLAAWAWWGIISSFKTGEPVPLVSPLLLQDHLKFIIPRSFNDVALTAFFRPDKPAVGGATCLLLFLENYSSRRRLVKVRLGKSAALVPAANHELALLLAPGQAAVYRCPFQLYPNVRAGDYEVKLRFSIKAPKGQGRTLKSASGKKAPAAAQLAVSSAYQLSPGFRVVAGETALARPLAEPAFLALSSPLTPPRFDFLRQVSEHGPHQAIMLSPPPLAPGAPPA